VCVDGLVGNLVDLLKEAVWALILVAVPVGLFTLAIAWWAMRNGHLKDATDSKAIGLGLKSMSKKKVKPEDDKRDLIQKKWAKFGGGFYGIVAFFTYIVIEMIEIIDMIMNVGGLWAFIKHLGLDVIIQFFIDAIMNFVSAMVWPLYWMQRIDTNYAWVFFVAAYTGYWFGLKLAHRFMNRSEAS